MKKNKIVGIVLLAVFALAVLGGIANGNFATMGERNIGYIVIYFGLHAALLVFGILNLIKKDK